MKSHEKTGKNLVIQTDHKVTIMCDRGPVITVQWDV